MLPPVLKKPPRGRSRRHRALARLASLFLSERRRWPLLVGIALTALVVGDILFVAWWRQRKRETRFDHLIAAASRRYRVDPALIRAVVWHESRFNHEARGKAGEIGLMQLRELSASEWAEAEGIRPFTHEHVIDPRTNVLAGTWYLAKLIDRYRHTDNALAYALADYNAGRTHVLRWATGQAQTNARAFYQSITYPQTQEYLRSVLGRYDEYQVTKER